MERNIRFKSYNSFSPISCHWSLSIPPENIRKLQVSEVSSSGIMWVKMTQKEEALVIFFVVLDGGMEKIDASVFLLS